jgi:hypothetical protein
MKVPLAVSAHGLSVSVVLTREQSHDLTLLQTETKHRTTIRPASGDTP